MHLICAPLFARIILVQAGEVAIIALVQRFIAGDVKRALALLAEQQSAGFLGPL